MTRMLSFLLAALFTVLLSLSSAAGEQTMFYLLYPDNTIEITSYTGQDRELVLPSMKGSYIVTSIGPQAFAFNETLTCVTIPDSITTIEFEAFCYCSSLTSISIPDSVTSIGNRAFDSCSSLTSITLPSDIKSIGNKTFAYCSSLTSISIPNSVTSIGDGVFNGCSSLTQISLPGSISKIGRAAFAGCTSLSRITLPSRITSIGDQTFFDCDALASIIIPDSVTSIGNEALCDCDALTSVIIPDNVTSIGSQAFAYSESLTSVTIPDSVTSIGSNAFHRCPALTLTVGCDSYALQYATNNGYNHVVTHQFGADHTCTRCGADRAASCSHAYAVHPDKPVQGSGVYTSTSTQHTRIYCDYEQYCTLCGSRGPDLTVAESITDAHWYTDDSLTYDDEGHWYQWLTCRGCGYQRDRGYSSHAYVNGVCSACGAADIATDTGGQYSFVVDSPYLTGGDLLLMDEQAVRIRVRDICNNTVIYDLAEAGLSIRIAQDNSNNFRYIHMDSKLYVKDASISSECYVQLCNSNTGEVIDEILVGVCNLAATKRNGTTEYASVSIVRSDTLEEMVDSHGKYLIIEDADGWDVELYNYSVSGKRSDLPSVYPDGYYIVEFDMYNGSPVTYSVSALYADWTPVQDSTSLIGNYDRECGIASCAISSLTKIPQAVSTGTWLNLVTERTHVEMKVPAGGLIYFNTMSTLSIDASFDSGVQLRGSSADEALFIANCLNLAVRSVEVVKAAKLLVMPQSQFEQFGDGYVVSNDVLWYSLNTGNYGIVWKDFFVELVKAFAKGGELEEIAGRITGIHGWNSFIDAYCKSMFSLDNAVNAITEVLNDIEDGGLSLLSSSAPWWLIIFYTTNTTDALVKLEDSITVAKTVANVLWGNDDGAAIIHAILLPSY